MTIKSASAPGRPGGYSLVELMTAASVAMALSVAAVPTLTGLLLDSRRTTTANELLRSLIQARSESVRLGHTVVVCGLSDRNGDGRLDAADAGCAEGRWSQGWLAAPWTDHDGDARIDAEELGPPMVLRPNDFAPALSISAGPFTTTPPVTPASALVIKPFSRRSSNGTITLCDRRGAPSARALIVSPTGRARIASRKASGTALVCPPA